MTGDIQANLEIGHASLMMIDDKKYLSSMGGAPTHERGGGSRDRSPKHDLALRYLSQGYVSLAIITGLNNEAKVASDKVAQKTFVNLNLVVDSVYMKSSADSTHSLIQLLNDLKPLVEPTQPDLKYRTSLPRPINLMDNIDPQKFSATNNLRGIEDETDFVNDDVPTNLEFVESYYNDQAGRSQWTASSSGSLNTSYSNTDLLLEEDLSAMVARNNIDKRSNQSDHQVVDFNSTSQRLASYEQRVKSHEPVLNFSENHFGSGKQAKKSHSVATTTTAGQPPNLSSLPEESSRHVRSFPHSMDHPDDSSDSVSESNSIRDSSFSHLGGTSDPNSFGTYASTSSTLARAPISLDFKIKDFTWDMHDGYDWRYTRDMITKVVFRVEYEAQEIRKFQSLDEEEYQNTVKQGVAKKAAGEIHSDDEDEDLEVSEDGEDVVADVLFNSIYISMSTHQASNDLRRMINKEINDDVSDTMSVTSTSNNTTSYATNVSGNQRVASTPYKPSPSLARELRKAGGSKSKLKLKRSKYHKVRIHLSDIHGNVSVFAGVNDPPAPSPNQYLLNRIDLSVTDAEILDNVTTSTWNKFLTYMRSAGDREEGASMFHFIIENVKPVPEIATSELVLNVFVLPLRLHVDQDTLDFITRFFEFQDDRFDSLVANLQDEIPFIQKIDVRAVKVKLDYKPKKVDYAGLRSGHTTEFMNFFILEEAEMTLNHVKLYGISGFPRLNKMLNGIWMPDIRSNQLGDVLAGLAPVRSIVRLGSGFKDLVVVPVREYKKDGRVMRSIQKGAWMFARNTTSELIKFGAKLAAGTQTILENAEQVMGGTGSAGRQPKSRSSAPSAYVDEFSSDEDEGVYEQTVLRDRRAALSDEDDFDTASNSTVQPRRGVRFPDEESVKSRRSQRRGQDHAAAPSSPGSLSSADPDAAQAASGGTSGSNAVSLYANQPVGVLQGIYSAYGSMGRNLSIAKHAVADITAQAAETGSAQGAAMAVMRAAPIAIIRPMIGATEAVSKTLLGVTNQLDPDQIGYVQEKYRTQQAQMQQQQKQKKQQQQGVQAGSGRASPSSLAGSRNRK